MVYSIEINLPISKVIELFINKAHFKEWKKDFVSYEHTDGKQNEVGSKYKLVFKSVTLFETVTSNTLPAEISCEYEHKRGDKTMMIHKASNRFISLGENKTRYDLDSEVTEVFGLLPRIIMGFMKGVVKKYNQDQLNQFKAFAEMQNQNL